MKNYTLISLLAIAALHSQITSPSHSVKDGSADSHISALKVVHNQLKPIETSEKHVPYQPKDRELPMNSSGPFYRDEFYPEQAPDKISDIHNLVDQERADRISNIHNLVKDRESQ